MWFCLICSSILQNHGRDIRNSSSAIFDDGLEEGGLRASSSYSHDINDHDNDKDMDCLQDRVIFLKRVSARIENLQCLNLN